MLTAFNICDLSQDEGPIVKVTIVGYGPDVALSLPGVAPNIPYTPVTVMVTSGLRGTMSGTRTIYFDHITGEDNSDAESVIGKTPLTGYLFIFAPVAGYDILKVEGFFWLRSGILYNIATYDQGISESDFLTELPADEAPQECHPAPALPPPVDAGPPPPCPGAQCIQKLPSGPCISQEVVCCNGKNSCDEGFDIVLYDAGCSPSGIPNANICP